MNAVTCFLRLTPVIFIAEVIFLDTFCIHVYHVLHYSTSASSCQLYLIYGTSY